MSSLRVVDVGVARKFVTGTIGTSTSWAGGVGVPGVWVGAGLAPPDVVGTGLGNGPPERLATEEGAGLGEPPTSPKGPAARTATNATSRRPMATGTG